MKNDPPYLTPPLNIHFGYDVSQSGNDWKCLSLLASPTDLVTPITFWQRLTLRSIRKGSSLCLNPFRGFTLWSESFEGLKGVGDQTTVSLSALLRHHPVPTQWRRHHGKNQRKGSWGPKYPSVASGQFWALRFGTTLQYGGHDCFHSEVPFGGWYISFWTHR